MSFDSHCHLTAEAFREDVDLVLQRAREAGIRGLVCVASSPSDARDALDLASRQQDVWCTAGLHPHEAAAAGPGWDDDLRELLGEERVVAVGECGLDFHYDFAPREAQLTVLERQVELAAEFGLPLVIHSRDADDETIELLAALPSGVRGVLHCFTGGDELLRAGLEAGWYVSFSGLVTFKRYDTPDQVRRVPADRILVETDAPYLAPVPNRGKRNEPAWAMLTARRLAEIRGEPFGAFAERLDSNARAFYRIDEAGA